MKQTTSLQKNELIQASEISPRIETSLLSHGLQSLAKWMACLPYSWLLTLGKGLGAVTYYFSRYRRHIADVNLRICFPEFTAKQRKQLIKHHFSSSGQGVMEALMAWWKPTEQLPPFQIHGLEHVKRAVENGKGVILLSAHFTCLELIGRFLAQKLDFAIIYRKQKNVAINEIMEAARAKIFTRTIDRQDGRGIYKALKDNVAIWLAADQDYGRDHSTFALFFGLPAAFITSPTRLANKTGAAVVPMLYHRLPQNKGYRIDFSPAIDDFAKHDADTNALITSQLIESAIKSHPEQYLWIHRRFKTRPEGKARFYQ